MVETERVEKGKPFSFASQISYYMSVLLRLRRTVAHGRLSSTLQSIQYTKNRSLSKITGFRGGDGESRTLDLSDANRTLYQLSYAPKQGIF